MNYLINSKLVLGKNMITAFPHTIYQNKFLVGLKSLNAKTTAIKNKKEEEL